MTATLAEPLDRKEVEYTDPSSPKRFFSISELDALDKLLATRERVPIGQPTESCKRNLFFGFFIDGTRNNFKTSLEAVNFTQTNVARLYSAFPGQSVPGVLPAQTEWTHEPRQFSNYFRVYTPGVGTPFPLVGDSGTGADKTLGGAAALYGMRRIVWTLVQAINNLHWYFVKQPLIMEGEAREIADRITLSAEEMLQLRSRASGAKPVVTTPSVSVAKLTTYAEFQRLLHRLHSAIQLYMPDPKSGRPRNSDPGQVKEIFVSAFGFSRGAAEARVFANWFVELCKLDARLSRKKGMTLGGFPVTFDFLGLFDTVATVGSASIVSCLDGHEGWADAEVSLRIPNEIQQCLHLVSAHEVRRCFPLDSVFYRSAMPSNCKEVVYPGVHSDVGGGYLPREQGKGLHPQGRDMLSRLPLGHMYRAARLAGVPLRLELAQQWIKDDYQADPMTIKRFNTFVTTSHVKTGTLTEVMRDQRKLYVLWRRQRRLAKLEATASFQRAPMVDRNDMRGANQEFEDEVRQFEQWKKRREAVAHAHVSLQASQAPGFHNDRDEEWAEISRFWSSATIAEDVLRLFDEHVHDSRAWFKLSLSSPESDEVEGLLTQWIREIDESERYGFPSEGFAPAPHLTSQQREWAEYYRKTGKVPEMPTDGREMMAFGAGYLRYRKIFGGGGDVLLSSTEGAEGVSVTSVTQGIAASAESVLES